MVLILEFTTYLRDVFFHLIAAFRSEAEKGGKEDKSEESEKKGRRKEDVEKACNGIEWNGMEWNGMES